MSVGNSHPFADTIGVYEAAGIKATVIPMFAFTRNAAGEPVCECSEGASCSRSGKHGPLAFSKLAPGERPIGNSLGQGYALVTGMKSNVFVVDTDGKSADDRFVEWWLSHPDAPELDTFSNSTPSGGYHYFFEGPGFPVRTSQGEFLQTPEEVVAKESSKIDIRGDLNGYVLMPGSPHVSGGEYKNVNNAPPMKAPAWLLEWPGLRGRASVQAHGKALVPVIPVDVNTDEGRERIRLAREACATMDEAVEGNKGHDDLWLVAMHLVRELELPIDTAHALITEVYNPRCTPPWSPKEITHKLENARDKSDRLPGPIPDWDLDAVANQPTPMLKVPERKKPKPEHRYSAKIGDQANGGNRKLPFANVCAILRTHEHWEGVLQYDEFRDRVIAVDPPISLDAEPGNKGDFSDDDESSVITWFGLAGNMTITKDDGTEAKITGFGISPDVARRATRVVAKQLRFHPLKEYLLALAPCEGAIDDLARDAMGLDDPFDQMLIRRFLVGAVRRVFEAGVKMDNMLVLKGDPGLKKSTFVMTLFGQEWTSENLTNIEDAKATGEIMNGKWAVEVGELKDIMRAGGETVLQFITRRSERFRPAYARGNAVDYKRTTVLIGTTNDDEIIRNATGAEARRFWIVEPRAAVAGKIDLEWIKSNRDRVWGEAVALAQAGERHWLEAEEEGNHLQRMKQYEQHEPFHDEVRNYCLGRESVRPEAIWIAVYGGEKSKFRTVDRNKITKTLRQLGCNNRPRKLEKHQAKVRAWWVPEDLAKATPHALTTSNVPDAETFETSKRHGGGVTN